MNAQELTKEYEKLATAFHELKKTEYMETQTVVWVDVKEYEVEE